MVGREEQLLALQLEETLRKASLAEDHYISIIEGSRGDDLDDPDNTEFHEAEESLAAGIETSFREARILAERLQLPGLSTDIRTKWDSYGNQRSRILDTTWSNRSEQRYCVALNDIWSNFQSMRGLALSGAVTGLSVLETILRNSAKIIAQSGLKPEHETQVRNKVLETLQLAFLDARREVSIAKTFKTYKPDIGVPSLYAAVEYKFLRRKEDMSKHLDEIFADMRGYGGHTDWRNFYAVLYQQGPFFTQADVDHEFREAGAPESWTAIVLNGP